MHTQVRALRRSPSAQGTSTQFGGIPILPAGHVLGIGAIFVPAGAQIVMVFGPTRACVGASGVSQRHPVARF
jgi:hypothetical protein